MSHCGRNEAATNRLRRWGVGILLCTVVLTGARSTLASWPKGVDPTGRYLMGQDGKPFFWLGDTAWNLFQIPNREDAELYLATRDKQGFTVIQAGIVMGEERVAGTARPNAYGDTAFAGNDPAKPRLTPGNKPGAAEEYDYWDHADYVIERAQAHGLTLGILPLFVGWRGMATSTSRPPTPTPMASSWASAIAPSRTSSGSWAGTTSPTPRRRRRSGTSWPEASPRVSPVRRITAGRS